MHKLHFSASNANSPKNSDNVKPKKLGETYHPILNPVPHNIQNQYIIKEMVQGNFEIKNCKSVGILPNSKVVAVKN